MTVNTISLDNIDNISLIKKIVCAREHVLNYGLFPFHPQDRGFNRLYGLVLQALEDANLYAKVKLFLDLWLTDMPGEAVQTFFDLESSALKQHLAKQVCSITLIGNADQTG